MEAAEAKCTAQHSKRVTASVRTVWMNPIEDLVMRLLVQVVVISGGLSDQFLH